MPPQTRRQKAEIVHCLFLDIVGYSRASIQQQRRMARQLQETVRAAPEFQRAQADGELILRDMGDGMALIFQNDPVAPAQCAVEIARAFRQSETPLNVRMGIHTGPITHDTDITDAASVYGGGINFAQRVMACGDAGHILLSQRSAEDLLQFEDWGPCLRELGEVEVKHGERLTLFLLCLDGIGRDDPPNAFAAPSLPVRDTQRRAGLKSAPAIPVPPKAAPPASVPGSSPPRAALEPVGGAVPLASRFYIARPVDTLFTEALTRRDGVILVKGPRQIGKTSLLARGLHEARLTGAKAVYTDLQTFNVKQMATADVFLTTVATHLARSLGVSASPRDAWDPDLGANMNMDWFMETKVLSAIAEPLVWGIDHLDRLFTCEFGGEVFGLVRAWHNRGGLVPDGPWARMTLAIAYATEAYLFITDLDQTPFNIGTRLTVSDFTQEQISELNARYGEPLHGPDEVTRFYQLVSGHPYLVRRGLDEMVTKGLGIGELEAQADREEGLYGDHLRRFLVSLTKDEELTEVIRGLLHGVACPTPESFYRLRSAGLLVGDSAREARVRCPFYASYLTRHLG